MVRNFLNDLDPRIVNSYESERKIRSVVELRFKVLRYQDYMKSKIEYDRFFGKERAIDW